MAELVFASPTHSPVVKTTVSSMEAQLRHRVQLPGAERPDCQSGAALRGAPLEHARAFTGRLASSSNRWGHESITPCTLWPAQCASSHPAAVTLRRRMSRRGCRKLLGICLCR